MLLLLLLLELVTELSCDNVSVLVGAVHAVELVCQVKLGRLSILDEVKMLLSIAVGGLVGRPGRPRPRLEVELALLSVKVKVFPSVGSIMESNVGVGSSVGLNVGSRVKVALEVRIEVTNDVVQPPRRTGMPGMQKSLAVNDSMVETSRSRVIAVGLEVHSSSATLSSSH